MTDLREPWARRGEIWQRAEAGAIKAAANRHGGIFWDHPEMVALMMQQRIEADELHALHGEERLKLMIRIRRDRREAT